MFYQCLENDCIPFQWEEHLKLHFIKIGRGRGGGGGGGGEGGGREKVCTLEMNSD